MNQEMQPGQPERPENVPQGAEIGGSASSGGSTGGGSAGNGGRGPVDGRGIITPPPPPPGGGYYGSSGGPGMGGGGPGGPGGMAPWNAPRPRFNILNVVVQVVALAIVLVITLVIGFAAGAGSMSLSLAGISAGPIEEQVYQAGETKQKIAIIPIEGFIDAQGSQFMHDCVEQVLDDGDVAAVILRVNSGGGEVGASEEMAHELERLKAAEPNLPIIASYGSVAASGAYYVSCGANEIFAQPTCVTGSIGVIAEVLTFQKLLNDKLGIKPEVLTATTSPKKSVANDVMRDWNQADRADVQHLLDVMHQRFIEVVRRGRGGVMKDGQLAAATQGQVFMASEAVDAGLVDHVGHLSDAIQAAAARANMGKGEPQVVEYGWRPAGLVQTLLGSASHRGAGAKESLSLDAATMRRAMGELGSPQMLYVYRP